MILPNIIIDKWVNGNFTGKNVVQNHFSAKAFHQFQFPISIVPETRLRNTIQVNTFFIKVFE